MAVSEQIQQALPRGLMQSRPMLISDFIEYAAQTNVNGQSSRECPAAQPTARTLPAVCTSLATARLLKFCCTGNSLTTNFTRCERKVRPDPRNTAPTPAGSP